MGNKLAAMGLASGVSLFGLTLSELGDIARIVAGFSAAIGSLAAAVYYFGEFLRKRRNDKSSS